MNIMGPWKGKKIEKHWEKNIIFVEQKKTISLVGNKHLLLFIKFQFNNQEW